MKLKCVSKGLSALLLLGLTACASRPEPAQPVAPATTAATDAALPVFDEVMEVGELPGQRLSAGECGLFLFAPTPTRRFVFFARAGDGTGKIVVNGEELTLALQSVDGIVVDQHFSQQSYRAPGHGLSVDLNLRPGAPTEGGTRIDGGAMRLSRDDGWSIVVPVAGTTSCIVS